MDEAALHAIVNRAFEIEERGPVPADAFERDWIARSRPLVMRGLLAGSPLLAWTPERLAAIDPARPVPVTSYRTGNVHDMRDRVVTETRVADYVAALRAPRAGRAPGPYPYLSCGLATRFPEMAAAADIPVLRRPGTKLVLFMGNDSVSGAHFHAHSHALVVAVAGRKIAVLHPPAEGPRLYPNAVVDPFFCHSRARLDAPGRFPLLRTARAAIVTLEPGDGLFVPVWWWHNVFGVGQTISVSALWAARRLRQRIARPFARNAIALLLEPTLHRWLMRFAEPVHPLEASRDVGNG